MNDLEHAVLLAHRIASMPDDRPELLRQMTDGAPTTSEYNKFLFHWMRMHPEYQLVVETGTDRGRSAAHMALGSPTTKVVSIDIDPVCSKELRDYGFPNVEAATNNAIIAAHTFPDGSIDFAFFDSLHEYEHMTVELSSFMPKLKRPCIFALDDIHLNDGMQRLWDGLNLRKADVSHLHSVSGFGLVEIR